VTLDRNQVTYVTWYSSQTKSHALHVTLVTNQITCATRDVCDSLSHVTRNRQRRNGCMVCHADSAGLAEYRDMPWCCILQTATVAGRRHHLQFSSQALTHWAHCTDRMLFVRPQVQHSDGPMSVSRRSLIAETWVRFQASFNGNRGNQSSDEALASCTRSVPPMLYRTIVAIFSVVDLGAVARQWCRCNTARVQLRLPDFEIYLCWLQRCSLFMKITLHLIPSTYYLYVVHLTTKPFTPLCPFPYVFPLHVHRPGIKLLSLSHYSPAYLSNLPSSQCLSMFYLPSTWYLS